MLSCRKRYLIPVWLTADFFLFTSLLQVGFATRAPRMVQWICAILREFLKPVGGRCLGYRQVLYTNVTRAGTSGNHRVMFGKMMQSCAHHCSLELSCPNSVGLVR